MISDEASSSREYPVERVDSLEQSYDLGRTIGRGEFAKVKVARCRLSKRMVRPPCRRRLTTRKVAIKIVKVAQVDTAQMARSGERLYREISILSVRPIPSVPRLTTAPRKSATRASSS